MKRDTFGALSTFETGRGQAALYRLSALEQAGVAPGLSRLPLSIRVLLEAALRNLDGELVTEDDVRRLAAWNAAAPAQGELPFMPARVLLQDFTGVPAVVDLAAMREAMQRLGGDPTKINPLVPVDLVIDHSVQVDEFGTAEAFEPQRRSSSTSATASATSSCAGASRRFDNFRVVPPGTGICHQVNLEYLARGRRDRAEDGEAHGRLSRHPGRHRLATPPWSTAWACSAGASAASRPRRPCSASRSPC